jgi:probable phosphoglycerate mutase
VSGPRRLVLLRHGRTAWNHALRVQGQIDVGLDDTGHAQAAGVAPAVAAMTPALLWTSDLARARETAVPVEAATGLTAVPDARLREFSLGEREGLTHEEYVAAAPAEFERFQQGHYDDVPGAETTAAVASRMAAALADLLAALSPGETGVAVTHGGAARIALGAVLGWGEDQFRTLRGLRNCAWAELVEHPAGGPLRLEAYNRTT